MEQIPQTYQLQDCFITAENGLLTIGNRRISRTFDMANAAFLDVTDRLTGHTYPGRIPIENPVVDCPSATHTLHCCVENNWGASEDFLTARVDYTQGDATLSIRFSIFPELPFVQSQMTLTSAGGSRAAIPTLCFSKTVSARILPARTIKRYRLMPC